MLGTIFARRSIRQYKPGAVGEEQSRKLLEAARAARSASNRKPWHFVVVSEPASLRALAERLRQYEMQAGRGKAAAEEYAPLMEDCRGRMKTYEDARKRLWERITAGERLDSCRVIAPGKVMPGVEISIGPSYLFVDQEYENVHFRCEDGEIVVGSPALA